MMGGISSGTTRICIKHPALSYLPGAEELRVDNEFFGTNRYTNLTISFSFHATCWWLVVMLVLEVAGRLSAALGCCRVRVYGQGETLYKPF